MRILILGCGWVGEEVAKYYIEKGDVVFATCTSIEKSDYLKSLGCKVAVVNYDDSNTVEEFPKDFDYVLNSIPASSKNTVAEISNRFQNVRDYLTHIHYKKHIYLSSIGIYPDIDFTFDEAYAGETNERLEAAEQKAHLRHTHIYRLGGLFGKNRIFAKYFQNRICTTGHHPANFVHVDDVVALIIKGFENDLKSYIYNIVAPEHPSKKEVILASAEKYGLELPSGFEAQDSFQKIVDSSKISIELDYKYIYPSPLDF